MTFPLVRPRGLVPLIILCFLGPLTLFVALAEEVREREPFGWDSDTIAFLQQWAPATDTKGFASLAGIAALTAGGVVLLWLFLLGRLLEDVFVTPRLTPDGTGHTFPSGTAGTTMAVVAGLAILAPAIRLRVVLLGGPALLAAGAALVDARWYHPSDVLAGWALALAWVTGVWVVVLAIRDGSGLQAASTTEGRRAQRVLPQRRVAPRRPLRGRPGPARTAPRRRRAVPVTRGTTLAPAPAPARDAVITLVYVAGPSRSGSTLLDLILGQILGVVSTGELRYVWTRGLLENEPCGCGRTFLACPFWHAVGEEAFGGWHNLNLREAVELEQEVVRLHHLPWLFASRLRPGFHEKLVAYAGYMERLYLRRGEGLRALRRGRLVEVALAHVASSLDVPCEPARAASGSRQPRCRVLLDEAHAALAQLGYAHGSVPDGARRAWLGIPHPAGAPCRFGRASSSAHSLRIAARVPSQGGRADPRLPGPEGGRRGACLSRSTLDRAGREPHRVRKPRPLPPWSDPAAAR